ncbi:hypothetical protein ACWIE7_05085 [Dietzia sp. NPDC055343]
MSKSRTALRSLGVLAAASGLALAGAGVASATTVDHDVDGNTVSATFTLEEGESTDACAAALVPPTAVESIIKTINEGTGGIEDIEGFEGVTILKNGTLPGVALTTASPSGTVTAKEVANNVYALITVCTNDSKPSFKPVTVGNPLDIISGLSSDGLLDTASSLLQGGDESGLGAILSSAVGGE